MPSRIVLSLLILALLGIAVLFMARDGADVSAGGASPGPDATATPHVSIENERDEPGAAGQSLVQPPSADHAQPGTQQQPGPGAVGLELLQSKQSAHPATAPQITSQDDSRGVDAAGPAASGGRFLEEPPEASGDLGASMTVPGSNEVNEAMVPPEEDGSAIDFPAPEDGVQQIEGLPPEAFDPGTMGPAPEDSSPSD